MEEQLLRLALMFATDRQTKTAWSKKLIERMRPDEVSLSCPRYVGNFTQKAGQRISPAKQAPLSPFY